LAGSALHNRFSRKVHPGTCRFGYKENQMDDATTASTGPDPATYAITRRRLHGIGECLMAGPQRRAGGRITLRVTPGGFATTGAPAVRLDGTDLFLQARDRPLLVADPARSKALWPILGRPGAVLIDGEIAGMWRPRKLGKHFRVHIELWDTVSASTRAAISEQAERLAADRQVPLTGIDLDGGPT
jgi:hypothetical protein